MSMYNLMYGTNRFAPILMEMLGLKRDDVGRFRDCFISDDGKHIVVYTRNGGGNRIHYSLGNRVSQGENCDCTACIMMYHVPKLDGYSHDRDDNFDNTYASIFFDIPDPIRDLIDEIMKLGGSDDPERKFLETIGKLEKGDMNDPVVKRTMNALKPLVDQINKVLKT